MSEHPPIPGYELVSLVARNGHLIYLARQAGTGRLVHLHVVDSCGDHGQAVAERLREQAQFLAALDHPNIIRPIEVGEARGYGFFSTMEYVEGDSLAEMGSGAPLPHHCELLRIVRLVASALDYAHGRGVVHGFLHPRHIVVGRSGHVTVAGFDEGRPGHPEDLCFGNPHFMAPEQIEAFDRTVPQTDVYALAEVVFLLLSGRFPFRAAGGSQQLLRQKCSGPVPSVRECRPELPRSVDLILQRAMALRPEDRFRSAGQFVEELDGALRFRQREDKRWWQFWL